VFGVPDPRLGEEVAAAIVFRSGSGLTAARVREHCALRIARHKIPRFVWLRVEPLPRNANGKFMKQVLRQELALADAV
jgi:long-chain acyl-CoA synthetase